MDLKKTISSLLVCTFCGNYYCYFHDCHHKEDPHIEVRTSHKNEIYNSKNLNQYTLSASGMTVTSMDWFIQTPEPVSPKLSIVGSTYSVEPLI